MFDLSQWDGKPLRIAVGKRLQWEPAQNSHVLLYPEGMVQLNETSSMILSLCDGKRTRDQLIAELLQRFPGADLADDVNEFLMAAAERGWISGS
jgi:pyrroloquinoline quinone biosynthesis protein D